MKTIVTLQNNTQRTLPIHYQGKRYELTPQGTHNGTMPVTESVAKFFLEHYGTEVSIVDDSQTTDFVAPIVDKGTVWLANITGDPDAPREIPYDVVREGVDKGKTVFGVNPDAAAHPVSIACYAGGGQFSTKQPDGFYNAYTGRKKNFTIKPYEVKEFPVAIARQFEAREYMKGTQNPPAVVRSRDPRDLFKPTMKWDLNTIRYWLMLAHPDGMNPAIHGPSEEEVTANCADEDELPMVLHQAKFDLWKRSFVLCANPDIPIPDAKALEHFIAKREKQAAKKAAKTEATA
jgi:hypothetical protein